MDMKSLLDKMTQLSQVDEETEKKPDFLDKDGDGNTTEPMKKAVADADKDDKEKVDEAGMIPSGKLGKAMLAYKAGKKSKEAEKKAWPQDGRRDAPSDFQQNVDKMDRMDKVKARLQKEDIDEAIAIQADGQEAMALLDMLKLAGQPAPHQGPDVVVGGCGMTEADRAIKHVNTPDEQIADMSAATPKGNDLHGGQSGYRAAAGGDNPMVAAMEGKLAKMFESLSKEVVSEISSKTKQAWLDKAVPDHYDKFVGKKPTTKQKLDTRRATIQKVSKELTGKKQFTDIDPVTGKWSND